MKILRNRSRRNAARRRARVRSLRRIGSTRRTGGATYYPLTDVQGTVWGYVDANNSIIARFEYDAWGNILSATSSVPALATNRYRFQCREWSSATGLVNFRAASGLETWGMAKLVATLNSLKHRAAMLSLEYANCPNPELLKQIEELERQAAMIQKALNEASAKNDRDRLPRPRRTRYR